MHSDQRYLPSFSPFAKRRIFACFRSTKSSPSDIKRRSTSVYQAHLLSLVISSPFRFGRRVPTRRFARDDRIERSFYSKTTILRRGSAQDDSDCRSRFFGLLFATALLLALLQEESVVLSNDRHCCCYCLRSPRRSIVRRSIVRSIVGVNPPTRSDYKSRLGQR